MIVSLVLTYDPQMQLTLQDCAGQETYDRMRPVAYADVHVILLCFSLDNPDSLVNAETTWFQVYGWPAMAVPTPPSPRLWVGLSVYPRLFLSGCLSVCLPISKYILLSSPLIYVWCV